MKIWNKKPVAREQTRELHDKYGIDPLTASILIRRGITSGEDIQYFLEDDKRFLHNPFLFANMEDDVMALTLWRRILKCVERILASLCEVLGYSISEIEQLIVTDTEMRKNFEIMAQALEDRQREEYVVVNTF